ncbi:MAG: hypothetical protein GXY08_07715 [Ruminococcus sp.]|nr:hypothetical protein [Ruminococcus sp.]
MKKLTALLSALALAAAAVPSFTVAETPVKGDVTGDGQLTGADAAEILRYSSALLSKADPSAECHYYENIMLYGDYNEDGRIDGSDTSAIMRDIINTTDRTFLDVVIESNAYIATEYPRMGDVNGDGIVDGSDATIVLKYFSHLMSGFDVSDLEASYLLLERGDVNSDGVIDGCDATMILKTFAEENK